MNTCLKQHINYMIERNKDQDFWAQKSLKENF